MFMRRAGRWELVVIVIMIVIPVVPVLLIMPAMLVFIPPAVMFAPAAFPGFMELPAAVVGVGAFGPILPYGDVQ